VNTLADLQELNDAPWRVDIRSILNQQLDHKIASTRSSSMQRQDPIQNRVHRLTMRERVFDKSDIPSRCSRMKAEMRDLFTIIGFSVSEETVIPLTFGSYIELCFCLCCPRWRRHKGKVG
jgi:hypothetical protein